MVLIQAAQAKEAKSAALVKVNRQDLWRTAGSSGRMDVFNKEF